MKIETANKLGLEVKESTKQELIDMLKLINITIDSFKEVDSSLYALGYIYLKELNKRNI